MEFTAEQVTAWATVAALVPACITAGIAIWAARIALQQIREARAIQREADAQESYRSYLEISLNNPELATPNYKKIQSDPVQLGKIRLVCRIFAGSF